MSKLGVEYYVINIYINYDIVSVSSYFQCWLNKCHTPELNWLVGGIGIVDDGVSN